jgi:hypothetical protein
LIALTACLVLAFVPRKVAVESSGRTHPVHV